MKLWEYIVRRLILLIFVIIGVTVLTFYLSRGVPGIDPAAAYVSERMTEEQIRSVIARLGLDQPLPVQYFYYLVALAQGEWGYSRAMTQPVSEALVIRFPATFELALVAVVLTLSIGIPLGIISALRNNRLPDHASRLVALTGVSLPTFWLGLLLILTFFFYFKSWGLPYLPSNGRVDEVLRLSYPIPHVTGSYLIDALIAGNWIMFWDALQHLVLPAITLSFVSVGVVSRITRSSMLEVLRQDYIVLARSKGLTERIVIYRHALKNAMIPTVTIAGLSFGGLLGGVPITETVFTWPGMGRMAVAGIFRNDTPLILGFVFIVAIITVLTNLIVDVVYAYLDPRIKY